MPEHTELYIIYKSQLAPMEAMINYKSLIMEHNEWIDFVNRTKVNILNSPKQYLSKMTNQESLEQAINLIFQEIINNNSEANKKYQKSVGTSGP